MTLLQIVLIVVVVLLIAAQLAPVVKAAGLAAQHTVHDVLRRDLQFLFDLECVFHLSFLPTNNVSNLQKLLDRSIS